MRDHGAQQRDELRFHALAGFEYFGVRDRLIEDAGGHVGGAGDAEDADAHVAGDDHFRDGGHADQVRADGFEVANFGGGFEAGAGKRCVDSFVNAEAEAFRFAQSDFAIRLEVSFAHIRKAWAEALVIRSDERIFSLQIDVVANHHQRALAVIEIDRAGGVGEDGGADAEASEDAHRKHHFPARISFVAMDAALHRGDGNFATLSDYEKAGVSCDGGAREAGNFLVRDSRGGSEFVGESAKAGAEDERDFRAQLCFRENEFRGARGASKFGPRWQRISSARRSSEHDPHERCGHQVGQRPRKHGANAEAR